MFIYGSFAMKHWFPDYFREPVDIDIVVYDNNLYNKNIINKINKNNLIEEIVWEDEAHFYKAFEDDIQDYILSPDGMLSVRMSHAMYNYNLDKAINDIIFLQQKGAKHDVVKIEHLRKYWKIRYAGFREKMDMNQPPEIFFNSNVQRFVNHDELHDLLKLSDKPAFSKILDNDVTVKVSKDKFDLLSKQEQINTFIEEISVLACERHYRENDSRTAFVYAAQDFLTRMTSGWYNIFLLENIYEVFKFKNAQENNDYFDLMNRIMEWLRREEQSSQIMINNI